MASSFTPRFDDLRYGTLLQTKELVLWAEFIPERLYPDVEFFSGKVNTATGKKLYLSRGDYIVYTSDGILTYQPDEVDLFVNLDKAPWDYV